jgi:hypothetical protein
MEIVCDAPPYVIVKACKLIGMRSPEDVRWSEITHLLADRAAEQVGGSDLGWDERLKRLAAQPIACRCGKYLPGLMWCAFTFASGSEANYLLGQCPRCRSIYWHRCNKAPL